MAQNTIESKFFWLPGISEDLGSFLHEIVCLLFSWALMGIVLRSRGVSRLCLVQLLKAFYGASLKGEFRAVKCRKKRPSQTSGCILLMSYWIACCSCFANRNSAQSWRVLFYQNPDLNFNDCTSATFAHFGLMGRFRVKIWVAYFWREVIFLHKNIDVKVPIYVSPDLAPHICRNRGWRSRLQSARSHKLPEKQGFGGRLLGTFDVRSSCLQSCIVTFTP